MSRFNDVGTSKVENKIVACIEEFLSSIQGISEISSKLMESKLSHTVGNMMNEILFGIHYDENDKNWIKIQKLREAGIKEIQVATPVNFLPWLRHLVPRFKNTLNWMIQGKIETHEEYKRIINEHSKENEECIVGFFYKEKEKLERNKSPDREHYSEEQLCHLVADLFGAGLGSEFV